MAGFLRGRRERIAPADVGLPAGTRRRTPGLRREEVAQLAFISTEYYTRLEQARGPRPSREVLAGLARALRLSDAERDHLHHLAGTPPGPPPGPSREVRPSILRLLRKLPGSAGVVLTATYDVIAWNDLAAALLGDFSAVPPRERNFVRQVFLAPPGAERRYRMSDMAAFSRAAVQDLRAAAARYPDDPGVASLVGDLLSGSEEFVQLWAANDVDPAADLRKTVLHPLVGPVTLDCDVLDVADRDQRVVIYTPEPGSPAESALRLLSVVGTQRMDAPG
ncbi:Helix-turn-helix domain-containing protein [Nocardiopsis flavescens]|uniref:Helix-turn-helix domain-containing protein n=2 Tax=Nocardiopsis flavescens TaxID=758803 RepID=A0A1M6B4J9_9ACTN|nr:Helix-turn-helix domain-containing protein [Nocardiopsis flavescens]